MNSDCRYMKIIYIKYKWTQENKIELTTSKADKITFAFSFSSTSSDEFRNLSPEWWIRSSDVTSYTVYKNT